jgi:hypothetical protein
MFGTNDDNQQSNDDPAMLDNVKQLASEPAHTIEPPSQPSFSPVSSSDPASAATPSEPNFSATHTAEPAQGFSSAPILDDSSSSNTMPSEPVVSEPSPVVTSDPSAASPLVNPTSDDAASSSTTPVDQNHLAGMKQEALEHLEPLVEHLEGTPEETFKTTMMMIQANDNHTLLEKALEAAKKIEDDKVRAQAMLDIVNEINYFSQNQ